MVAWVAVVALLASSAQAAPNDFRQLSHGEMSLALRECGLNHLTVSYEDDFQSDVVKVDDIQVTDAQLECAFWAQDMTGYLLFWEPAVSLRYYAVMGRLTRPRAVARAQSYFANRPELGAVPERAQGESDLAFAQKLERFCGPDAAGMITDEYGSTLTISPEWLAQQSDGLGLPEFSCVWEAITIAGLEIGIVGNEKASDSD